MLRGGIVNIVFTILNYKVLDSHTDMWGNVYGNAFYFLGESISGIIFVLALSKLVHFKSIEEVGEKSLVYYGIHIIFIEAIELTTRRIEAASSWRYMGLALGLVEFVVVVWIVKMMIPFYERLLKAINTTFYKIGRNPNLKE